MLEPPRVERLSRVMVDLLVGALLAAGVPLKTAVAQVLALLRHCQSRN